jgi:hypothetical protein
MIVFSVFRMHRRNYSQLSHVTSCTDINYLAKAVQAYTYDNFHTIVQYYDVNGKYLGESEFSHDDYKVVVTDSCAEFANIERAVMGE